MVQAIAKGEPLVLGKVPGYGSTGLGYKGFV